MNPLIYIFIAANFLWFGTGCTLGLEEIATIPGCNSQQFFVLPEEPLIEVRQVLNASGVELIDALVTVSSADGEFVAEFDGTAGASVDELDPSRYVITYQDLFDSQVIPSADEDFPLRLTLSVSHAGYESLSQDIVVTADMAERKAICSDRVETYEAPVTEIRTPELVLL